MRESGSVFSARAFLSHSSQDSRIARWLKSQLDRRGVATWAYETDLPFGSRLEEEIRKRIKGSDCLLVLLSRAACTSEWVAREIGLARQLQERSETNRPLIIGVRSSSHCPFPILEILDFDTGEKTGALYDFSESRCLTPDSPSESIDDLASFLRPTVTFISSDSERHTSLLRASFDCYEELFPDLAERDDPESIRDWLDEARNTEKLGSPWREVYAVLSVADDDVIGFAFLSAHIHRKWCFGNYLGVRRVWREGDRARALLMTVSDYLRELIPGIRSRHKITESSL